MLVYYKKDNGLLQPSFEEDNIGLGLSMHKIQLFSGHCQTLIRTVKLGTHQEKYNPEQLPIADGCVSDTRLPA